MDNRPMWVRRLHTAVFFAWIFTTIMLKITHPDQYPGFWILSVPVAAILAIPLCVPLVIVYGLVGSLVEIPREAEEQNQGVRKMGFAAGGLWTVVAIISFLVAFISVNAPDRFWAAVTAAVFVPLILGGMAVVGYGCVVGVRKFTSWLFQPLK